jgi:hypothetical protein
VAHKETEERDLNMTLQRWRDSMPSQMLRASMMGESERMQSSYNDNAR